MFEILVRPDDGSADRRYLSRRFSRSNQGTCLNHRVLVKPRQHVDVGDILADGPAIENGEMALGRNVLVAFMPWEGYNFEDAILLSQDIVKDDKYTSIHIDEFEIEARDTKLGPEEITRDIPNFADDALRNLDERGIIYIGAEVMPGDIQGDRGAGRGDASQHSQRPFLEAAQQPGSNLTFICIQLNWADSLPVNHQRCGGVRWLTPWFSSPARQAPWARRCSPTSKASQVSSSGHSPAIPTRQRLWSRMR